MKNKKIPMRTCIVTREKLPKMELIRIVKYEDKVSIDLNGKANGRGVYIKRDMEVLDKAIKSNAIGRGLEIDIPDSIYEELRNIINSK